MSTFDDELRCPWCDQVIELARSESTNGDQPHEPEFPEVCPHCGRALAIQEDEIVDDLEEYERTKAEHDRRREEELSQLHVNQMVTERRALHRIRSYYLIGALFCFGTVAMLIGAIIRDVNEDAISAYTGTFVAVIPLAGYLGYRCCLRAIRILRELKQMDQHADPETPPNFSTLSDGSQSWKSLDDVK